MTAIYVARRKNAYDRQMSDSENLLTYEGGVQSQYHFLSLPGSRLLIEIESFRQPVLRQFDYDGEARTLLKICHKVVNLTDAFVEMIPSRLRPDSGESSTSLYCNNSSFSKIP